MSGDHEARVDLRTRRRNETRREVIEVSLGLFRQNGFAHTTVDDIARAVGISERTFFRYFPTKEDVLLVGAEEFDAAIAGVDLGDSLESALLGIERICAEHLARMLSAQGETFARTQRLIAEEPQVSAALFARQYATSVNLRARLLAAGITDDELTAQLVVELAYAALRSAIDTWSRREPVDIATLSETYDRARIQSRALLSASAG